MLAVSSLVGISKLSVRCIQITRNRTVLGSDLGISEGDPTSIMSPWYTNDSCNPYTPRSSPCLIGNYPDYSINVSSWKDVAAGLAFAQEKNIRLVIKNTGHEQAIPPRPFFFILIANFFPLATWANPPGKDLSVSGHIISTQSSFSTIRPPILPAKLRR